jgi:hypothetical protein
VAKYDAARKATDYNINGVEKMRFPCHKTKERIPTHALVILDIYCFSMAKRSK